MLDEFRLPDALPLAEPLNEPVAAVPELAFVPYVLAPVEAEGVEVGVGAVKLPVEVDGVGVDDPNCEFDWLPDMPLAGATLDDAAPELPAGAVPAAEPEPADPAVWAWSPSSAAKRAEVPHAMNLPGEFIRLGISLTLPVLSRAPRNT